MPPALNRAMLGFVLTDLVELRNMATAKELENAAFRRHLKAHQYPEEPFRILATEVEAKIDCQVCANCCRHTRVSVTPAEMDALARHLEISRLDLMRRHTAADPRDSSITLLRQTRDECTFLKSNRCTVYEARPQACRDFPYLTNGEGSVSNRLASTSDRASYCPIVYNTLELYKEQLGYQAPPPAPDPSAFIWQLSVSPRKP